MSAFTGLGFNENTFAAFGIRILRMEREFNRKAGFTSKDDRLPEWMTKEALPPHDSVFDVSEEILDEVHNHTGIILKMLGNTKMGFAPPIALMGEGCHLLVPDNLAAMGLKKALIVTDKGVVDVGILDILKDAMDAKFFDYVVYDGTQPNPTVANVEAGLEIYRQEKCDCLVSLGGGSPHDCAKAIGVMVNNPGSIIDYMGLFGVWQPSPVLVAVNTTSGTGAEATVAAVISDPVRHLKAPIADPKFLPIVAVNDPLLMRSMPPHITAGTGMDALTHAIEAYTSNLTTPYAQGMGVDTAGLSADIAAGKAITAVEDLMDSIGVPKTVTALAEVCRIKISQDDIPELVAHAAADLACGANPIFYSLDDFNEIYEKAW